MDIKSNNNIPVPVPAKPAVKAETPKVPVKVSVPDVPLPRPRVKDVEVVPTVIRGANANVYAVSDEVFSIFRSMDGKMRTQVRNLETGEVTMTPPLDGYEFFKAVRGDVVNHLASKLS
jgi:hypothetical protein